MCVSVSVYMRVYVHIIFIREISVCTYVYRDEKKKGEKNSKGNSCLHIVFAHSEGNRRALLSDYVYILLFAIALIAVGVQRRERQRERETKDAQKKS